MKDIIKISNGDGEELIIAKENIIGMRLGTYEIVFLTRSTSLWIDMNNEDKARKIYTKIRDNLLEGKEVTELN